MTLTHHLTKRQLRDLEQELRSECARLERSITSRTAAGDAIPSPRGDRHADAQTEGAFTEALETRILDRHQRLVSALRRLEEGSYGSCLSCHNPIPYGRLLVMPEATYCVGCSATA